MANHMEDSIYIQTWPYLCKHIYCLVLQEKSFSKKDSLEEESSGIYFSILDNMYGMNMYETRKCHQESTRSDAFGEKANHHPPIHNKFY